MEKTEKKEIVVEIVEVFDKSGDFLDLGLLFPFEVRESFTFYAVFCLYSKFNECHSD